MPRVVLSFWDEHINPIRGYAKRLTARYNFERDVKKGYTIVFIDKDNLDFGAAYVTDTYTMTVREFANVDWKYHKSYVSVTELLDELKEYYPDVWIQPVDQLRVIEWGKTFRANPVYEFKQKI